LTKIYIINFFGHLPRYTIDPDPSASGLETLSKINGWLFFLNFPVLILFILLFIVSLATHDKNKVVRLFPVFVLISIFIWIYFIRFDNYCGWLMD
jgi:hypothetical protein